MLLHELINKMYINYFFEFSLLDVPSESFGL